MRLVATGIPGCVELQPRRHDDARGHFVKPFAREMFERFGLAADWREVFWSVSRRGTIRGFHAQLPPHEHSKVVFCVRGESHNVALDLRRGSPTFGTTSVVALSALSGNVLYVPHGVGHAFQALSEDATLVYLVGSEHAPEFDAGVRWDSAGVEWPIPSSVVSQRDVALPPLSAFRSPFEFTG